MKAIHFTIVTLVLILTLPCHSQQLTIFNHEGASLSVWPVSLETGEFTFRKEDQEQFKIPLSTLTPKSQRLIINHFNRKMDILEKNRYQNAHKDIEQIEYSDDHTYTKSVTIKDDIGDMMPIHPYPEMDIRLFTVSKGSGKSLEFEVIFEEALPVSRKFEMPYRVWIKFDLDNDSKTGNSSLGGIGEDISIAISGWGEDDDWTHYTVPKSDDGRKLKVEIDKIEYSGKSLRFEMKCNKLTNNQVVGFKVQACSNGGNNVDRAPDSSTTLPFAFSANALDTFLDKCEQIGVAQ